MITNYLHKLLKLGCAVLVMLFLPTMVMAAAPGNITDLLSATGSNSFGDVTLSWSSPGTDANTAPLDSGSIYHIQYSTYTTDVVWSAGSTNTYWFVISTEGANVGAGVSYTLTGLFLPTTYYFRVWTANAAVEWSGISNGTTWYLAPVEFVCSIKSSGGDFDSLSTWESANDCDLTVSTVVVFSHGGITGAITDGSKVYGLLSGATGYVTHVSATQAMIIGVEGSFISGEQVYKNQGTNYVTISNPGNSVIVVAECYPMIDTTGVYVNNWHTRAQNYIVIRTPASNRHSGVWNDNVYRMIVADSYCIYSQEANIRIEGLQLYRTYDSANALNLGLMGASDDGAQDVRVTNCIIRGTGQYNKSGNRGICYGSTYGVNSVIQLWNNIIYDFGTAYSSNACYGILIGGVDSTWNLYNNTIYNCQIGFYKMSATINLKNNLVQGCTDGFNGSYDTTSNNLSDLAGDTNLTGTVTFVDVSNRNLHISGSDTVAKNTGADLSGDDLLKFSTDIDGDIRPQGASWDIGADETYSPGTIADLASETGTSFGNVKLTWSAPGEVGSVGALGEGSLYHIQYATYTPVWSAGGTNVYWHVISTNGITPTTEETGILTGLFLPTTYYFRIYTKNSVGAWSGVSNASQWYLPPAEFVCTIKAGTGDYSTLSLWETATQCDLTVSTVVVFSHSGITGAITNNSTVWGLISGATGTVVHVTTPTAGSGQVMLKGIEGSFISGEQVYKNQGTNFVTISNVGNSVIAVAECYADWPGGTGSLDIDGWTTGPYNFIKVYAPASERHNGAWNSNKFNILGTVTIREDFVRIDGLQISKSLSPNDVLINVYTVTSGVTNSDIRVSNNILKALSSSTDTSGIRTRQGNNTKIWNNVIYNFTGGSEAAFRVDSGVTGVYFYNNTIYNSYNAVNGGMAGTYVKNNLVQGSTAAYYSSDGWGADSNYNITNVAAAYFPPGANSKAATVIFANSANDDFHLAGDTVAVNGGFDLSTDVNLPFNTDIDGDTRPQFTTWDIGADENDDNTPPDAVTDLTAATYKTAQKIKLTWTNTGDDGTMYNLQSATFRIRYSSYDTTVSDYWTTGTWTDPLSRYEINIATNIGNRKTNKYIVSNLTRGVTYYFRVWTQDFLGNLSAISNGATAYAQTGSVTGYDPRIYWDMENTTDEAPNLGFGNITFINPSGASITNVAGQNGQAIHLTSGWQANPAYYNLDAGNVDGSKGVIEFWFKPDNTGNPGGVQNYFFSSSCTAVNSYLYAGVIWSGASCIFYPDTQNNVYVQTTGWSPVAGTWYYFKFAWDRSVQKAEIWIDGVKRSGNVANAGSWQEMTFNNIGVLNRHGGSNWGDAHGTMDEFFVHFPSAPTITTDFMAAASANEGEVVLTWSSPGDDGTSNPLITSYSYGNSKYKIQYSTYTLFWTTGTAQITISTTNVPALQVQKYALTGLPNTELAPVYATYYFRLWTCDEWDNWSLTSYGATNYIIGIPPSPLTDVFASSGTTVGQIDLEWTSAGDDAGAGAITGGLYRIKYATYSTVDWQSTVIFTNPIFQYQITWATNTVPGNNQKWTLAGLSESVTYYIKVYTSDECKNWSDVSNTGQAWVTFMPPNNITTLEAFTTANPSEIKLNWLAPGDDGTSGNITNGRYRVKYATFTSAEPDFWETGSWNDVQNKYQLEWDTTCVFGMAQSRLVTGITETATFYFRLWARDEGLGNWSAISNGATNWAYYQLPDAVTDLSASTIKAAYRIRLTWTSTGDDGNTGTVTNGAFRVRYSTFEAVDWDSPSGWTDQYNQYEIIIATTLAQRRYNEYYANNLTGSVTYYFRLWMKDEGPLWSAISNGATNYPQTFGGYGTRAGFDPCFYWDMENLSDTVPNIGVGNIRIYNPNSAIVATDGVNGNGLYFPTHWNTSGHYALIDGANINPDKGQIDVYARGTNCNGLFCSSGPYAQNMRTLRTSNPPYRLQFLANEANGVQAQSYTGWWGYPSGEYHLYKFVWDRVNSNAEVWIDGTKSSYTSTTAGWATYVIDKMSIGGRPNNSYNGPAGDMDEFYISFPSAPTTVDLACTPPIGDTAVLSWLCPGDDGTTGMLVTGPIYGDSQFRVHWSSNSSTVFWSTASAQVTISTVNVNPYTSLKYCITSFPLENTSYYFRLWTRDDWDNWSEKSNMTTCYIQLIPPDAITDLASTIGNSFGDLKLTWSTPSDDLGTTNILDSGSLYYIQYATFSAVWGTSSMDGYTFAISTSGTSVGTKASFTLTGLYQPATYYFRIWTQDESPGNWSAVSNGTTWYLPPVEFICTIKDVGGDFASLSAWEAANDCNLTVSTVVVFSHGGLTGTISNGSKVWGLLSGATGYVTHVTAAQVMIEGIEGKFISGEHVYKNQGSNYVTISNCGNSVIVVAECYPFEDTTACYINGWYTSAKNYIVVRTPASNRHSGIWDDNVYRMNVGTNYCITSNEANIRIEGIQFNNTNDTTNSQALSLGCNDIKGVQDIRVTNCIIKGTGNFQYNNVRAIAYAGSHAVGSEVRIWNNIIYDFGTIYSTNVCYGIWAGGVDRSLYIYNNTVYNCQIGIQKVNGTVVLKNNLVQGCTNGYNGSFDTTDSNMSDLAGDTDLTGTVEFSDAANKIFRLTNTDTVARDQGADLTSDSYLRVPNDVKYQPRPFNGAWDIGADEMIDAIAPSAVSSLAASQVGFSNKILLFWSSPGDDGDTGTLNYGRYAIQYSTDAAFVWNRSTADLVISTINVNPGQSQYCVFDAILEDTSHYFHIWVADDVLNWSPLSNGATCFVQVINPGAITDLTAAVGAYGRTIELTWSAPGDDGYILDLTDAVFLIQYSTWANQTQWIDNYYTYWSTHSIKSSGITISTGNPTAVKPGEKQSWTITGLSPGTTYYFRAWTRDEYSTHWSLESNPGTTNYAQVVILSIDLVEPSTFYNFGTLDTNISTVSMAGLIIRNGPNSTVRENYTLMISTMALLPGTSCEWEQGVTAGNNRYVLYGVFSDTRPALADFGTSIGDDIIISSSTIMTSLVHFSTGTAVNTSFDGNRIEPYNILPLLSDTTLWFRLDTPVGTTTVREQVMPVVITATESE
ncbi:MAG: hypothetical protein A2252_00395 [Elusimicrobia bacterium RIFOXYA2_FULL_39_19]|nr:MAG: hypothetical protein A2252_00395 [Elusimicrobia bacterium RIFOXYA2_FULL_39_19]